MSRADLPSFAKQYVEKFRRTGRDGFNLEVIPFASSSQRFAEMNKLLGDCAAIAASRFAPAASRDQCGSTAHSGSPLTARRQTGKKPRDLAIASEPIQAQFDRLCCGECLFELAPHRRSIFRGNDRTNFRLADHFPQ